MQFVLRTEKMLHAADGTPIISYGIALETMNAQALINKTEFDAI